VATTLAGKPLVSASWSLLRRDPSMIVLLVVGGISSSVAFALVALPASLVLGTPADGRGGPVNIAVYALALFASTFVSTFFLGAVVSAAMERADGGDPTFSSAMAAAWDRRSQLVAWAALSTAVGVALRLLERFGIAGTIARLLAGVSWAVATWFAIPVIMSEGTMPIETIKRSSHVLTSRFGSNVRATVRLGLIFLGIYFLLFVLGFAGLLAAYDGIQARNSLTIATGVLLIVAAVMGGFVVSAVGSAIGAYLRTVLYRYATGQSTPGIDPRLLPPMIPMAAMSPAYDAGRFGTPTPQPYAEPQSSWSAQLAAPTYPAQPYADPQHPSAGHPAQPYADAQVPPPAPYAAPAPPPPFVEPLATPGGDRFEHDVEGVPIPGILPAPQPPAPRPRHLAPPTSPTGTADPASAAGRAVFLPDDPQA